MLIIIQPHWTYVFFFKEIQTFVVTWREGEREREKKRLSCTSFTQWHSRHIHFQVNACIELIRCKFISFVYGLHFFYYLFPSDIEKHIPLFLFAALILCSHKKCCNSQSLVCLMFIFRLIIIVVLYNNNQPIETILNEALIQSVGLIWGLMCGLWWYIYLYCPLCITHWKCAFENRWLPADTA